MRPSVSVYSLRKTYLETITKLCREHFEFYTLWFSKGTSLMNLSKTYDFIPHDVPIAKLECYGIDKIGLSLMVDYFSRRK